MDSPLLAKSKQFALDIIKVCNKVKSEKRESVLTNQLIRSGTSIGANIREAFYGHGKNDFIAKLQIALKECSESEYQIELLIESGYYDDKTILENCIELKKILISSINTAKKNNNQVASILFCFFKFAVKIDASQNIWDKKGIFLKETAVIIVPVL